MTQAYLEGAAAFRAGKTVCPYPGGKERMDWTNGYNAEKAKAAERAKWLAETVMKMGAKQ